MNTKFIQEILENINNFQRIENSIIFQRFKQECIAIHNNSTTGLRVRDILPETVIEMIHLMNHDYKDRFYVGDHQLIEEIYNAIKDNR